MKDYRLGEVRKNRRPVGRLVWMVIGLLIALVLFLYSLPTIDRLIAATMALPVQNEEYLSRIRIDHSKDLNVAQAIGSGGLTWNEEPLKVTQAISSWQVSLAEDEQYRLEPAAGYRYYERTYDPFANLPFTIEL